jgi:uncharacterized protein YkwD
MTRTLAVIGLCSAILLAATASTALAHHYDRLLATSAQCANQENTRLSAADQERVMRCLHNKARAKAGRYSLRARSMLASSSDGKTADMMRCNEFSHNACGRPMVFHFQRVGYTSCRAYGWGENIVWSTGGTARAAMSAWLHSDPHRANILSTHYRDLGIGLRRGTFLGRRGASVWTAHFGYRYC